MQQKSLYIVLSRLPSLLCLVGSPDGRNSRGARPSMEHETTGARSCPDTAARGGACQSRALGGDAAGSLARRRAAAILVHDSEDGPHARGARSVARWRRRLLYQAGTIELDLEISRSKIAGRLRLLGQVATGEPGLTQVGVTVEGPSGHLQSETD